MADWETASRCPECSQPGKVVTEQNLGHDGKLLTLSCGSKFCQMANNDVSVVWIVQRRADGSIPDPQNHMSSPKEYKGFDDHVRQAEAYAQMLLNQSLGNHGPQG